MRKRNLTKIIKEEGNRITPNVIDKVYDSLGISYVQESKKVEAKVKKDGKRFVPNVKNNVYASLDITQRSSWTRPLTLSVISTALIAGVTLAIIIPTIKKSISVEETQTGENETPVVASLNAPSTVNMRVVSASEAYSPEVMYSIDTEGNVSLSDVVTLNDDASNIINNFDTVFNNRSANSAYDVGSFTNKYLSTALNLGYLERQDSTKVNKINIEFIFDNSDQEYFNSVIASLKEEVGQFVYNNKIITIYTCVANAERYADVDSEIVALIRTAYELATKLFVTPEGETIEVLCFSSNFDDWVEKYKNASKEELNQYIDFLKYVDEMISDDSMKAFFIEDLIRCSLYQVALGEIEDLYDELADKYGEIVAIYNEKFHEHRPNVLDPFEDDGWDWWDDYGHDHPHDHGGPRPYHRLERPGPEEPGHGDEYDLDHYNQFKAELATEEFVVNDSMNKQAVENVLDRIEWYADELSMFYMSFSIEIEIEFDHLIGRIDNGEFFDENRPPHEDHYQPEPDGWDDEFEDWWEHHWF